jgi:hypothetical protein
MYNIPFDLFLFAKVLKKKGLLGPPSSFNFSVPYQTRHAFALTIDCPALHPKACANSDMFPTTLLMR